MDGIQDGIAGSLRGLPQNAGAVRFALSFQDIKDVAFSLPSFRSGPSLLEYQVRTFQLDTMYLDQVCLWAPACR